MCKGGGDAEVEFACHLGEVASPPHLTGVAVSQTAFFCSTLELLRT